MLEQTESFPHEVCFQSMLTYKSPPLLFVFCRRTVFHRSKVLSLHCQSTGKTWKGIVETERKMPTLRKRPIVLGKQISRSPPSSTTDRESHTEASSPATQPTTHQTTPSIDPDETERPKMTLTTTPRRLKTMLTSIPTRPKMILTSTGPRPKKTKQHSHQLKTPQAVIQPPLNSHMSGSQAPMIR